MSIGADDMTEQALVEIALRHLQLYLPVDQTTPVCGVTFYPGDAIVPYDHWIVLFETRPGCDPPFSAVEVIPPEMTPRIFRVI